MNARRLTLAILTAMLGAMVFAAAPAVAAEKYVFSTEFAHASAPYDVAANESTEHVYVAEEIGNRSGVVDNYEASGATDGRLTGIALEQPYGVTVDNSAQASKGDIYVSDLDADTVYQFNSAGAATAVRVNEANIPIVDQGNRFEPRGVAVSPSGDLLVADSANGVVDEFSSSGVFIAQIGSAAEINNPQMLAIDGAGDLYVASEQGVVEFDASGGCVDGCAPIDAAGHYGVAVDGAGDVFVGEGTHVSEYSPSRVVVDQFGGHSSVPAFGGVASVAGLVVDDTTSILYLIDEADGAVDAFSPADVPNVSTSTSSSPAPGEVMLNGTVNPESMAVTSCEFEYGSSTAYGQSAPCVPEADSIPVDSSEHAMGAKLAGLAPGEYHYRLAAGNANGENQGEDRTFSVAYKPSIEGASFSDVGSSSAQVSAQVDPKGAASTYYIEYGTSTSYGSSAPRESIGAGVLAADVAVQVSGLEPETTYHFRVVANNELGTGYSGDLSFTTLPAPAVAMLGLPDGRGYELVSPVVNANGNVYVPPGGEGFGESTHLPMQAAADGSAVEYVADPLATGGSGNTGNEKGNLYVATHEAGGGWAAVDLETPGLDAAPFQALFSSELSNAGTSTVPAGSHILTSSNTNTRYGEEYNHGAEDLYDSVSGKSTPVNVLPDGTLAADSVFGDDGDLSHVISADGSRIFWTDVSTGVLYVREDDTSTVAVSAGAAEFWGATPDGRYVFYTEGEMLWRFDVEGGTRDELVSPGTEVQGVIGMSENGEYVYFSAKGVLSSAGNAAGQKAQDGADNLYLLHENGATWEAPRFIVIDESYADPRVGIRQTEVTPNGHSVVFQSGSRLTGYNDEGQEMVYVYQAGDNTLLCASCNSSGAPPVRPAYVSSTELPRSYSETFAHRWISEDGTRVFFESNEALVPQDTDGTLDVYEWEQSGTGSCEHGTGYNGGCIYLLSSGTSSENSYLLDTGASGDDVVIVTRSQLVSEDQNENVDVYDVRVGASRPPTAPECTGSGCQGVPAAPPIFATPSSVTFNGVGNFTASAGTLVQTIAKAPTRPQRLAKALKACRAKRSKHVRAGCEAQARKRYGAKQRAHKSDVGGGK